MDVIAVDGITLGFDPDGGIIDSLTIDAAVSGGSRPLFPLHRAPWLESGEILPASVAHVERHLAGDFFCAPFARASADVAIHGWSANGTWEPDGRQTSEDGALTARYLLRQTIEGARLSKEITLCPGQPIVYQRHVFEGGSGRLPVAHHAMLHVPGGARLSFSRKSGGSTPAQGLETDPARGRSTLQYPQHFDELTSVRRADGVVVDASVYPFAERHEDLIVLTEASGAVLGWSAAVAKADGFVFFAVKDASVLPQTVLWMSNGGRFYPPWNGRHRGVIGLEEAVTGIHLAGSPEGEVQPGILLGTGRSTVIPYAFGAIAAPDGWTRVVDIAVGRDTIRLTDVGGDTRSLPFQGAHFRQAQ